MKGNAHFQELFVARRGTAKHELFVEAYSWMVLDKNETCHNDAVLRYEVTAWPRRWPAEIAESGSQLFDLAGTSEIAVICESQRKLEDLEVKYNLLDTSSESPGAPC